MTECKHGMKSGCVYCHAPVRTVARSAAAPTAAPKRRTKPTALSEKMNDRMTALKKRLREIRGE